MFPFVGAGFGEYLNTAVAKPVKLCREWILVYAYLAYRGLRRKLAAGEAINVNLAATLTMAFGTISPEGSATCPRMVAILFCGACARRARGPTASSTALKRDELRTTRLIFTTPRRFSTHWGRARGAGERPARRTQR
jgi:hypothetical protein